jgi:predicted nuclease of predicted toxin-antitoxin system
VWSYAIEKSLAIITKDGDFRQRSFLEGYPPKIIWVALGNCSTAAIENLIRARSEEIASFLSDGGSSFLSLS